MKRSISILGSTGSIGLTALNIISKKKSLFSINLLAADKNYKLICNQINKFKPKVFLIILIRPLQKSVPNINRAMKYKLKYLDSSIPIFLNSLQEAIYCLIPYHIILQE